MGFSVFNAPPNQICCADCVRKMISKQQLFALHPSCKETWALSTYIVWSLECESISGLENVLTVLLRLAYALQYAHHSILLYKTRVITSHDLGGCPGPGESGACCLRTIE